MIRNHASTYDAVVRTIIFTQSHKGTKKGTLKIFKILFVISVATCETGLFTRSSYVYAFPIYAGRYYALSASLSKIPMVYLKSILPRSTVC